MDKNYKPDILNCMANLSNDEVFTSPNVVNKMLDLLPDELWSNPDVKFLDPACKTGVFLREIAKRLIKGLEYVYPDLQERVNHIMEKQLYGISITEITALMTRRTLYCSRIANGTYSIVENLFDTKSGNIYFERIEHSWAKGKCEICGASQKTMDRETDLETHAYPFLHKDIKEIFGDMKFDVIITNPPYQLETGGAGRQAKPIYNLFVEQAKKLNPKYLAMIIPSRWFAGGMGLESFRNSMMNDNHITKIVDYSNAKECFPQNSISGGVCYFLRERDKKRNCEFTNINNGNSNTLIRPLNEFNVLVRYNLAVSIIHKIKEKKEVSIDTIVSPLMPYGLSTNYRGKVNKDSDDELALHSSSGITYIKPEEISKGFDNVEKYKVLISKTSAEHAGEPGKDGKFRVITSSAKVIGPKEVCTHSYFTVGEFDNFEEANNVLCYLKTKFVRFLILLSLSSINLSKLVFPFVPMQDFTKSWTDNELYKKYNLTEQDINFIESMIKPI